MARKILKAKLDPRSIDDLIQRLETYEKGIPRKMEILIGRLQRLGVKIVRAKLNESRSDDLSPTMCEFGFVWESSNGDTVKGKLFITSEPIESKKTIRTGHKFQKTDKEGNPLFDKKTGKPIMENGSATVRRLFWPHLAYEFGAGYEYNHTKGNNPWASELRMGPGTFPYQTHVPVPGFWFWSDSLDGGVEDETSKARMYRGTQATQPMYNAWLEMEKKILSTAKEVFNA